MNVIKIRRSVVDAILDHARLEAPNECCGLLIGSAAIVERANAARNLLSSPTRYRVDPADHFVAIREARGAGLTVVGAYHSHPAGAPIPSPTDRREATYPDYLYVIVSPGRDDRVAGYRLVETELVPVELVIVA